MANDFRDVAGNGNIAETLKRIREGKNVNPKSKYYNPLMHALKSKKERTAFILLRNGAKVNVKDNHNRTPFYYALDNCSEDMVLQILKKKPSLKNIFKKRWMNSYLHMAVSKEYSKATQILLERKVKVNLENNYSKTPLYSAVDKGNYKIVKLLLKSGATIESKKKKKYYLLHMAVQKGNLDIVKILVKNKAGINLMNAYKKTPLEKAIDYKHDNVAVWLIKKGASVKIINHYDKHANLLHLASRKGLLETVKLLVAKKVSINKVNEYKSTPLDLALYEGHESVALFLLSKKGEYKKSKSLVHISAEKGFKDILKRYVNKSNVSLKDKYGNSPLHLAARKGNVDCLKILLGAGGDINAINKNKITPLGSAVSYSKIESVKVFLEHGSFLKGKESIIANAISNRDKEIANLLINSMKEIDPPEKLKKSPLHRAIEKKYSEIAKSLILKMKNIDVRNSSERTPLHIASDTDNIEIVRLLLGKGANVNLLDYKKQTPLHCSSKIEVIKLLLSKGANVNAIDKSGKTPLSIAVRHERNEIARYLIDNGAVLNNDQSLLQYAVYDNNYEMCSYLLKKGLDVNNNNYKYQMTPLHVALENRRIDFKIIDLLINSGADLNKEAKNGITPIFLALGKNKQDIINLLVKKGADINKKNALGNTPLHSACKEGLGGIDPLIKNGAELNVLNNKHETPLHVAVRSRKFDSIKKLIKLKININAKNIYGETPLIILLKYNRYSRRKEPDIAEILIKSGADINLKDNIGKTAIDYAKEKKRDKILRLLK